MATIKTRREGVKQCQASGCENQARMLIQTTRPTRDRMITKVYWDDRSAPGNMAARKSWGAYCKSCGMAILAGLHILVDEDDSIWEVKEKSAPRSS